MRFLAALVAAVALPAGANTLEIAPGETYTVGKDQQRLVLSSLKIGDGATVRFAEGVVRWQVRADRAEIGADVTIDGRGDVGSKGIDGKIPAAPASCKSGDAGTDGALGQDGGEGVSVRMQLGLAALGSLSILADGGAGGAGGAGGDGAAAATFDKSCPSAPVGGDAGAGGNGGRAGDAGDVTFQYWAAVSGLNLNAVESLVSASAKAGKPGAGGLAGQPGAGSEGHYINRRTLSGSRKWMAGGDEGASAKAGLDGAAASNGKIVIEQPLMVNPVAPAPVASQPAPAKAAKSEGNEEVDQLKSELRALMERLEKLESQK